MSVEHHRKSAPAKVPTAVITVSDTRTLETDTGGGLVAELLGGAGHTVVSREIVPDVPEEIAAALSKCLAGDAARAVILTGGTGVAPRDVTPEAVEPLLGKKIDGFSVAFHMKSMETIGTSTIQSRALAGVARATFGAVTRAARRAATMSDAMWSRRNIRTRAPG